MVEIREVRTKAELREFVDFPNQLYRDVPQFIPAMYGDDMQDWDRRRNPAFAYCEGKCWLAYRDGKPVGRIAAVLNKKANEKWHLNRMRFWQVDFIDDPEVSSALFSTVEAYAREKGCDEVHGPLGFTDLDSEGMLVDGFDEKGMFITFYNFPYYRMHLERLGYGKDVDWIEFLIDIPYDERTVSRMEKLSERVLRYSKLHVAEVTSRKQYGPLLEKVFALVNEAYAGLYGTVPISEEQIRRYAKKFIPIVDPRLTCFVLDENDKLVSFGISAPSMADALKRSRGRLFPFGWIGVLKALKTNDTLDLFLIAVSNEYRNMAVNAVVMYHILKGCHSMGIRKAETGPQLETNEKIQHQWNFFNTRQHKRRRCFVKRLDA
ncbi:MAG: GNAT family N-acetyltransferase [Clostridia bacterium]|nr:GNAT family N-acetyltransferase [Clostridia bacterium]